ncbi:MAG: permease [Gammaproteobacteria bacterium]|nr:permease [Gammaproteobacteria bacterium]
MNETLTKMTSVVVGIMVEAGFWIILSLFVGGLVHEYLPTARLRTFMRRSGWIGVLGAIGLGAMLPMCSCGVIPLAVSFYLSGVRLATVMAFTVATPVINPAAVILSYALLGPQLTLVYVVFGLVAPFLIGYLVEYLNGAPVTPTAAQLEPCCAMGTCEAPQSDAASPVHRFGRAIRWGFGELGPEIGPYIGIGAVLAAVISVAVPPDWISHYLGVSAPFTSLIPIALLGASIYVCAVGQIPLAASLLAAGAGPGSAIVFLVTGAATNLPEFFALQRVLGTRAVLLYVGGLVSLSLVTGTLVNVWFEGSRPIMDPLRSLEWSGLAARVTPVIPQSIAIVSALAVAGLIALGIMRRSWRILRRINSLPLVADRRLSK